jgi:cholesterol transport system auxiliary component
VNGSRSAQVEIFVKLLNDRNGVVRAARTFTAAASVSGSSNDDYVAALDRAFGEAATEIVDWTGSAI